MFPTLALVVEPNIRNPGDLHGQLFNVLSGTTLPAAPTLSQIVTKNNKVGYSRVYQTLSLATSVQENTVLKLMPLPPYCRKTHKVVKHAKRTISYYFQTNTCLEIDINKIFLHLLCFLELYFPYTA